MTYQVGDPHDFQTFLKKFHILKTIPWDYQDIIDLAHHVVAELIREDVSYSEIRFSIDKYLDHVNMTDVELIKFVRQAFDDAQRNSGVEVRLLLALKYEAKEREVNTAHKVCEYRDSVVGIDFVGDEKYFNIDKMKPITDKWNSEGLGVVVHAGESQGAHNVRAAVEYLNPQRIAHGIRVPSEDPELLDVCKDRGICFDIAVTSNILTGVVDSVIGHPAIKMLRNGNIITIGTDDSCTCRSSLVKEYGIIKENWGLTDEEIEQLKRNSIRMALAHL